MTLWEGRYAPSPPGGGAGTAAWLIFLHEADRRWRVCHCRPEPDPPTSRFYIEINRDFYDTRHGDGSTLLFCDGHAKWRKKASVLVSDW